MTRFADELEAAFRPRENAVLDEDGVDPYLLRTSRWRRTSRGLYVPGDVEQTATQRIVSAAALMPPGGVIGGWAAARVHGAEFQDGLDERGAERAVDVLLPGGLHRLDVPGVAYRRASLGWGDTCLVNDFLVTTPVRTAVDLACWARSVTGATVQLDLLLEAGLPLNDLRRAAPSRRRGSVQARSAIDLARCGSRSPGETRLRLLYVREVGAPAPLLNPTLLDRAGRFLAMPDLFDAEAGLAMEYDGASWASERELGHRDRRQHREDNVREEGMERHGIIVVRADAADLGPYRRQTSSRFQQARLDGLGRDRRRDRWVVQRPTPGDR